MSLKSTNHLLRGLTPDEIAAIDQRAGAVKLSRNAWILRSIRYVLRQPSVRVVTKEVTDL